MNDREWRLSWEMADPHWCANTVAEHGKGVYKTIPDDAWDNLPWCPPIVKVVQTWPEIKNQYETLRRWAETHEQPVRNVKLESRTAGDWEEQG